MRSIHLLRPIPDVLAPLARLREWGVLPLLALGGNTVVAVLAWLLVGRFFELARHHRPTRLVNAQGAIGSGVAVPLPEQLRQPCEVHCHPAGLVLGQHAGHFCHKRISSKVEPSHNLAGGILHPERSAFSMTVHGGGKRRSVTIVS